MRDKKVSLQKLANVWTLSSPPVKPLKNNALNSAAMLVPSAQVQLLHLMQTTLLASPNMHCAKKQQIRIATVLLLAHTHGRQKKLLNWNRTSKLQKQQIQYVTNDFDKKVLHAYVLLRKHAESQMSLTPNSLTTANKPVRNSKLQLTRNYHNGAHNVNLLSFASRLQ